MNVYTIEHNVRPRTDVFKTDVHFDQDGQQVHYTTTGDSSVLTMIYLSIATLVLVATQASAKLSPEKHKDDISSAEHYKDGVHDSKYDHDAFLGERLAQEWEKLPPTEVKQRLRCVC